MLTDGIFEQFAGQNWSDHSERILLVNFLDCQPQELRDKFRAFLQEMADGENGELPDYVSDDSYDYKPGHSAGIPF
jgi:hypothetical protein